MVSVKKKGNKIGILPIRRLVCIQGQIFLVAIFRWKERSSASYCVGRYVTLFSSYIKENFSALKPVLFQVDQQLRGYDIQFNRLESNETSTKTSHGTPHLSNALA